MGDGDGVARVRQHAGGRGPERGECADVLGRGGVLAFRQQYEYLVVHVAGCAAGYPESKFWDYNWTEHDADL